MDYFALTVLKWIPFVRLLILIRREKRIITEEPENFLNLILLLPVGILLPFVINHKVSWKTGLLMGITISAIIEIAQLISCRGLFEFDDIIHNGVGCVVGVLIGNAIPDSEEKMLHLSSVEIFCKQFSNHLAMSLFLR